jgi:aminotransferase
MAQHAALEALLHGEPYVQQMVAEYDRRRKLLVNGFNQIGLPTFNPKGAFYAFPHVSVTGLDDETFCNRLLQEEHVAIIPGNAFGLGGEGFARTCYATGYDKLEEALERIERFVNRI